MAKEEENKKKVRKDWHTVLEEFNSYNYQILTPRGRGTGFQISYLSRQKLVGVATAYHVVEHSDEWKEPIKIKHHDSGQEQLLKEADRVILTYPSQDLAFIIFKHDKGVPVPSESPKLIDAKTTLKSGVAVGWTGFPVVAPPNNLCFFSGHISCYLHNENYYLVDGVVINGVSGGMTFYVSNRTGEPVICGVITAYIPNRRMGETHPGLGMISTVEPYLKMIEGFNSLDEAEEEADKQKTESAEGVKAGKKSVKNVNKKRVTKKTPKKAYK